MLYMIVWVGIKVKQKAQENLFGNCLRLIYEVCAWRNRFKVVQGVHL
jgi:hypothetical protein